MTDSVFGMPDADGWYEWKGDDMVRPAGQVEIELRCGIRDVDSASNWDWTHGRDEGDIVKWRPANPGCRRIGCSHEICEDKE